MYCILYLHRAYSFRHQLAKVYSLQCCEFSIALFSNAWSIPRLGVRTASITAVVRKPWS